jgi:hypothetical protein
MVSGTGGNQFLAPGHHAHFAAGAPDFERACPLKVIRLEKQITPQSGTNGF